MENQKPNELLKGIFDSLTDEQKEKETTCKNSDELNTCLGELGVALPDELLDTVAGGTEDSLFERLLASALGIQIPEQESGIPMSDPY